MEKPWQEEAWFKRNIDKLKDIRYTATPWNVRDQLDQYIKKLEETLKTIEEKHEEPKGTSTKKDATKK